MSGQPPVFAPPLASNAPTPLMTPSASSAEGAGGGAVPVATGAVVTRIKTEKEVTKERKREKKERKRREREALMRLRLTNPVSLPLEGEGDLHRSVEKVTKKIRDGMIGVVEILTGIARLLEKWDENKEKTKERKKKIRDHLKKYSRRLQKLYRAVPLSTIPKCNLPLGLIRHVDNYRSSNTWLMELYTQATKLNDIARGELQALESFRLAVKGFFDGKSPAEAMDVPVTPACLDLPLDPLNSSLPVPSPPKPPGLFPSALFPSESPSPSQPADDDFNVCITPIDVQQTEAINS